MKSAELLSVLLLSAFLLPTVSSQSIITLDGTKATHVYTGHGGLSAGASSRLLIDYPESQRNDILDMLFLPQHGMNLHLLKVEIGGDAQSTDGTEPSHQHSREDLSCTRGYELFLLREAKKRNPEIITYGLSWGAPGFINNGTSFFGEEMMKYQTQWVECIQQELGFVIDYIGIYNERYWGGVDYVKGLRSTLDSKGFQHTKIVLPDGGYDASILTSAATDSIFNSSFDVIGLHYPCNDVHPEVAQAGKSYWASEHWWDQPDFNGASTWGHLLNYNWVAMNMTSTISWSPLWSVYTNLEDQAAGLMLANLDICTVAPIYKTWLEVFKCIFFWFWPSTIWWNVCFSYTTYRYWTNTYSRDIWFTISKMWRSRCKSNTKYNICFRKFTSTNYTWFNSTCVANKFIKLFYTT
jgi:galactosylceramidase